MLSHIVHYNNFAQQVQQFKRTERKEHIYEKNNQTKVNHHNENNGENVVFSEFTERHHLRYSMRSESHRPNVSRRGEFVISCHSSTV